MTAPRVGLFMLAFPRRSETFIVTKVLKLLERGIDVQIFTLSDRGDWHSFRILDGRDDVRARVHSAPPLKGWRNIVTGGARAFGTAGARSPLALARLSAHEFLHRGARPAGVLKSLYEHVMFAGQRLDILHVEFDYYAAALADLKTYLGCRLVVSARGNLQKMSTYSEESAKYLFERVDAYHVISHALEANLDRLGLPRTVPRWKIEPAIDLSLFEPPAQRTRRPDEPLRIISINRLAWQKGYEFAIDAVAKLRDRGVPFEYRIYGEGDYLQAVRYAIRHHHLEDRVTLAGGVSREAIPGLLASADVMLHAAIEEGFCNAVIEAQAMELPIVTSDAGGLPENVEADVTGFVVPRRDPVALAEKLELLAADPATRHRMGRAGRARALSLFDLDKQADAFVAMYDAVMRGQRV